MTVKGLYEAMLIELNKIEAPSLLLEDFNYLLNKAIYQYTNKWYNQYDVNQQTTDNLRVLKSTAYLTPTDNPTDATPASEPVSKTSLSLFSDIKEFELPRDYFHMLNCVCEFSVNSNYKCYTKDSKVFFRASRLTSDMWGTIINNFYMRPSYKKPYFFIHNINLTDRKYPTNPRQTDNKFGTDLSGVGDPNTTDSTNNYDQVITIRNSDAEVSTIDSERTSGIRYGNPSPIRMEIRYGKSSNIFTLEGVYIDYLKVPQTIVLTQEQLDSVEDITQILEFPDYVCYEIINELVKLVMENASDPRLQTHIPVNQTIAPPAGLSQKQ